MTPIQKMRKMLREGKLQQAKQTEKADIQYDDIKEDTSRKTFKSSKTLKSSKKTGKESSSSSEDEDNIFDENQRFLEQKSEDSKVEERNLIENLERADVKDEEKGVAQSVGSSSSLNAQNAVRMLRQSLKNMKTPKILKFANWTVIIMCLSVFALTLSQFLVLKQDFTRLKKQYKVIGRVSKYAEYIISFNYNYMTLYATALGQVDLTLFDSVWWSTNKVKHKATLLTFLEFQLTDLSQAGENDSGQTDLHSYLFDTMELQMLVAKKEEIQQSNFESYLRLFVNSINRTIDEPTTFFGSPNHLSDDYLYFIYSNEDEANNQNIKNFDYINSKIKNEDSSVMFHFLGQWCASFILVIFCFIVIYPVMLESKRKIHDSLVLFTRISLRDVDYFQDHFMKVHFFLNSIENIYQLMREIDKFIENQTTLLQRLKKAQDSRAISRSRDYKGVRIDSLLFLLQMCGLMCIFLAFIFLKDYKALLFLNDLDTLKDRQIAQHSLLYNNLLTTKAYQELLCNFINSNNPTVYAKDLKEFQTSLALNESVLQTLMDNYSFFGQFLASHKDFVQQLMEADLCLDILALAGTSLLECQKIFEGVLSKGYSNFFIAQPAYLKINIDNINQVYAAQGYTAAQTIAASIAKDKKLYEMGFLYPYVYDTTYLWYNKKDTAVNQGIDDQVSYNQLMVIFFSIYLFLFVVLVWWYAYADLKKNSKWVNSFILLIPIQLHRENQYLRSYLKQKLNLNNFVQS